MKTFKNANGNPVLMKMVKAIHENKDYLGEVDGLIGDGDHGMNMNKGFMMFGDEFGDQKFTFADGLDNLGNILFSKIGGSMGPIYGTIFMDAAEQGMELEDITVKDLADMLGAGLAGLQEIVEAQVGDKTLVDTLAPAVDVLKKAQKREQIFRRHWKI